MAPDCGFRCSGPKLSHMLQRFTLSRTVRTLLLAAMLVVQGTGLAEARLDAASPRACVDMVNALRGELDRLEGTLTVQRCPVSLKDELDLWGAGKDALPLMCRIKQQFDPARILNPGRYLGGI